METINMTLAERVAVLETKLETVQETMTSIETKLDSLLELKAKGMGALGLVGIVVGSGFLGLIAILFNFFQAKGPHL